MSKVKSAVLPASRALMLGVAVGLGWMMFAGGVFAFLAKWEEHYYKTARASTASNATLATPSNPQTPTVQKTYLQLPHTPVMSRGYTGTELFDEKFECRQSTPVAETGSGNGNIITRFLWVKTGSNPREAQYFMAQDAAFSRPVMLYQNVNAGYWLSIEGGDSDEMCLDVFLRRTDDKGESKESYQCKRAFSRKWVELRDYSDDGKLELSGACRRL